MYIEMKKRLKKDTERLEKEKERYEAIKEMHELKRKVYEKLDIDVHADVEEYVCKLYIYLNSVAKVTKYMVDKGIRMKSLTTKNEIKVTTTHITEILRGLKDDEQNEYKRLARIQYKENYKRTENLINSINY